MAEGNLFSLRLKGDKSIIQSFPTFEGAYENARYASFLFSGQAIEIALPYPAHDSGWDVVGCVSHEFSWACR